MNQHEVSQMMIQAHQDPINPSAASAAMEDAQASTEKDVTGIGVPAPDTEIYDAASEHSRDAHPITPMTPGMNLVWLPTIDLMQ